MLEVDRHGPRGQELDAFTHVAHDIVNISKEVIKLMTLGMHRHRKDIESNVDPGFANEILNNLFLSRLGSNVLLSQYLACIDETRPSPIWLGLER